MALIILVVSAAVVVGAIMALVSFTDLRSTKSVVIFFICLTITVTAITISLAIDHKTAEIKYGTITPKAELTLAPNKQYYARDLYDIDCDTFDHEPSATIVYARWSDGSSDGINLINHCLSYDYDEDRAGNTIIIVMKTDTQEVFEARLKAE